MLSLQQSSSEGECKVPTLRKSLTHPVPYLIVVAASACLLLFDVCREPDRQISARAYLAMVWMYQTHVGPVLKGRVRCRYSPTCSRYSSTAVRRYGIVKGFVLTVRRLARCRRSVPLGTEDPVPTRWKDESALQIRQQGRPPPLHHAWERSKGRSVLRLEFRPRFANFRIRRWPIPPRHRETVADVISRHVPAAEEYWG